MVKPEESRKKLFNALVQLRTEYNVPLSKIDEIMGAFLEHSKAVMERTIKEVIE